jgi:hypothetical protein
MLKHPVHNDAYVNHNAADHCLSNSVLDARSWRRAKRSGWLLSRGHNQLCVKSIPSSWRDSYDNPEVGLSRLERHGDFELVEYGAQR